MIQYSCKNLGVTYSITKTIDDYREIYPKRDIKEGAKVTRFAPSPTGYVHLGGLYQAVIDKLLANSSDGIFYLRPFVCQ